MAEGRIQFLHWCPTRSCGRTWRLVRVKIIAITNKTRSCLAIPNVPTVAEAGYPQLTTDGLVGLFATKELPPEIRNKIAVDLKETLLPTLLLASGLAATGQVLNTGNPAEFAAAIEEQNGAGRVGARESPRPESGAIGLAIRSCRHPAPAFDAGG